MLICWVDVETTGLSPRLDHILEIAIVVTGFDLVELTGLSMIVNPALGRHGRNWGDRLDENMKKMHHASGLLREIDYAASPDHVDEAMAATLRPLGEDKYFCAGYKPAFDHAFVKEQMPGLSARLQPSFIDVISMRRLIRDFAQRPDLIPDLAEATGRAHRAMSDVQDAIAETRIYSQYLSLVPRWA